MFWDTKNGVKFDWKRYDFLLTHKSREKILCSLSRRYVTPSGLILLLVCTFLYIDCCIPHDRATPLDRMYKPLMALILVEPYASEWMKCLSCNCSELGFTWLFSQIDQEINKLVSEQQKSDAKLAHDKSELEQIKQDIKNANKQKYSDSKALEKKVFSIHSIINHINHRFLKLIILTARICL